MNFNKTLGLPFEQKVELLNKLNISEPLKVDLAEEIKKALKNRMEIFSTQVQYDNAKFMLQITSLWYMENTFKYKQDKYTLDTLSYNLKNAQSSVELSVRKAYIDMLNAYDNISVMNKNIEQLQTLYDATITKFDLGLATASEVTDMFIKLNQLKNSYNDLILGYNLLAEQFKISAGVGLASGGF